MNSRIKRRIKYYHKDDYTPVTHWVKTNDYGDWREYHVDPFYEMVGKFVYTKLRKICPYSINPKRLGSKPWHKLRLLLKLHEW